MMKYDLELYEFAKVLSVKQMLKHGIELPDDPQAQAIKQELQKSQKKQGRRRLGGQRVWG
jgi:hypothetical protein